MYTQRCRWNLISKRKETERAESKATFVKAGRKEEKEHSN
jgi:hypothetical protein